MIKLIYDLETTGLSEGCEIWQVAMAFEIDGQVVDVLDVKMRPSKNAVIEDKALEVGNITREYLDSLELSQSEAFGVIMSKINKYKPKDGKIQLVGYNSLKFDDGEFRKFFSANGKRFGDYFINQSHDVMAFAALYLEEQRGELKDFKQSTIAKFLGIDVKDDQLHNALYDIMLTYKIYKIIYEDFRNGRGFGKK